MPVLSPLRRLSLLLLGFADVALAQQPEARFVSQGCRVAFAYPADWEVVPGTTDPAAACRFSVRPRNWQQRLAANDSVDLFTIAVEIQPLGVWTQVSESSFRRRGARWVVLGRQDLEAPADSLSGSGWSGLRGTATQGCYRVDGPYVGLCDQPTALVGTATRSLTLVGGPQSEDVFNRILTTLRFQGDRLHVRRSEHRSPSTGIEPPFMMRTGEAPGALSSRAAIIMKPRSRASRREVTTTVSRS